MKLDPMQQNVLLGKNFNNDSTMRDYNHPRNSKSCSNSNIKKYQSDKSDSNFEEEYVNSDMSSSQKSYPQMSCRSSDIEKIIQENNSVGKANFEIEQDHTENRLIISNNTQSNPNNQQWAIQNSPSYVIDENYEPEYEQEEDIPYWIQSDPNIQDDRQNNLIEYIQATYTKTTNDIN